MENPGKPKTPKPEERHGLQDMQAFQNEAGVARGRQDFSECHESSATRAGEWKCNLDCHETAHDAPVNTLTKIDVIRRAHGVRVNQQSFQFTRLSATRKTLLEKRIVTFQTRSQSQNKTCASKTVLHLLFGSACQRFALPALGRGRRSRPTRKMIRRMKLLEIAAESPASGARCVSVPDFWKTRRPKTRTMP